MIWSNQIIAPETILNIYKPLRLKQKTNSLIIIISYIPPSVEKTMDGELKFVFVWPEQQLLYLKRPNWKRLSLPYVMHLWMFTGLSELRRSFLCTHLSYATYTNFSSPDLIIFAWVALHLDWFSARSSKDRVSMLRPFMSLFTTPLYLSHGCPVLCFSGLCKCLTHLFICWFLSESIHLFTDISQMSGWYHWVLD